ncbi:MAG: tRNA (adenosine(37)-N6)-dimethylallyltransferase MiaA [Verrucomicrobiales bacterium]|nr:tRNA (adenosine(37)-N6)-dimethylallyltransferase MiaA [Verrucomicrobiales bacterium]
MPENTGPVVLVAGPTAVGKSAVALAIAVRADGEILAADSMQVYRGLDIGTAKPGPDERARVPHHLIDLVGPGEGFDARRWLDASRVAAADVRDRGRLPIFCGGTGLYFRAWVEGLDELPSADAALRRALEASPLEGLLAELEAGDPATFARIDRRNPRRVVRAVEILRLGGGVSEARRTGEPASETRPGPLFVLRRRPDDLRRRMETRVDAMFDAGLVDETRELLKAGLAENPVALQAIGYRQVVEYLRGERDLAATRALVKTKTWQYGRRQMTWFRHRDGVHWIDVEPEEDPEGTALRILGHPARAKPTADG